MACSYDAMRSEYGSALLEYGLIDEKMYFEFSAIGNLWLKIIKEIKENIYNEIDTNYFIKIINEIEERETTLFSKIAG